MSRRAEFHRALCELVRCPGGGVALGWLVEGTVRVMVALEAGDRERARELLDDMGARAILSQAFPEWFWSE